MNYQIPFLSTVLPLFALSSVAAQGLSGPDWITSIPSGSLVDLGLRAATVDANGFVFITATTGTSTDNDVLTAGLLPDGTLLWQEVYDGPASKHDQVRAIAPSPFGSVWVTGNTQDAGFVSNVMLLEYGIGGGLLQAVPVPSAFSEYGGSIVTDSSGNVFVAGGSISDALVMKFSPAGTMLWRRTWSGPAFGPFSQDSALRIALDPVGNPIVLIHGVMSSNQPDYVVQKYSSATGTLIWQSNWGTTAAEYPFDMVVDAAGEIYVTGLAIDGVQQKYSTIRMAGANGALVWQGFDHDGFSFSPAVRGIAVDGRGGVYVTGSLDPDGNQSNNNDNFFTVRRDAATGALTWTHAYGANCFDCLDLPSDLAVDAAGNLLLVGSTDSPPVQNGAIVIALDAATGVEIDIETRSAGGNPQFGASFVDFDAHQNAIVTGMSRLDPSQAGEVQVVLYPTMPTARVIGAGCTGAGATPLTLFANSAPTLPNAAFSLSLQGGPPSLLQAIVFADAPAPAALPFGDPGCFVHVGGQLVGIVVVPSGSMALPLPAQPSLRGALLVTQGLAFPVAPGLVTSNALLLQLGN